MAKRRKNVLLGVFAVGTLFICLYYLTFNPRCLFTLIILRSFSTLEPQDQSDVTIVTAFLDLGTFRKGGDDNNKYNIYTPQQYLEWAKSYKYLANPLVVYTDSSQFEKWFMCARTGLEERTNIIRVDKEEIPVFQKRDKVLRVISDPDYPKFHPNTVLPEYALSQHAKMDLVDSAIKSNVFGTKYFAWIDVGYFRHTSFRKRKFWIVVPPEMDDDKVALTEVETPDFSLLPEIIFKSNKVWVGGGMVLATLNTYLRYISEYRKAMEYFLHAGLVNTDQQVIYSMFTDIGRKALNITSKLQTYTWSLHAMYPQCWFYLGYLCYKEE